METLSYEIISHPKYKYRTLADFHVNIQELNNLATEMIRTKYVLIHGWDITILKGYAWDGPSGPAIDTIDFMRPSLVHDVFYQLMDEKIIPESFRRTADKILYRLCRAEGMVIWRAAWVYLAVRSFGWARVKQ